MELIHKYFPELSKEQTSLFEQLEDLYADWNSKINVISRKDFQHFYERHVLHSLGVASIIKFKKKTRVMDVGTGGGFPGIPLAIFFPEATFYLVDSIGKKTKVAYSVAESLGLKNVSIDNSRAEDVNQSFDFIIGRAVVALPDFYDWVKGKIKQKSFNDINNGVLYLRGGALEDNIPKHLKSTIYNLSDCFSEEYFETKKLVHLCR